MSSDLSVDTAMRVTTQAFQPYGCTAQRSDDGDQFAFEVTDMQGNKVLSIASVPATQFRDPIRLAGVLEQVRLDLIHAGRNLQPWTMPFIPDPESLPETPPIY